MSMCTKFDSPSSKQFDPFHFYKFENRRTKTHRHKPLHPTVILPISLAGDTQMSHINFVQITEQCHNKLLYEVWY